MANATYLTYEEYVAYGGKLPASDFPVAELKARKRIDYLTDSRVAAMAAVPEEVKVCMYSLITAEGVIGVEAQAASPLLSSFSTDGYSESYGSATDQVAALRKSTNAEIRTMLYGVTDDRGIPLLYRGLDV